MAFSLLIKISIGFTIIISIVISILLYMYLPATKNEIYITYPSSSDIIQIIRQNLTFNKEYTTYNIPEELTFDYEYNFYILPDKTIESNNVLILTFDNNIKPFDPTFQPSNTEFLVLLSSFSFSASILRVF